MLAQVAAVVEALAALAAQVGRVSVVRAQVVLQRARLPERLVAHGAHVRLEAAVPVYVIDQVVAKRERLAAYVAAVRLHLVVALGVPRQIVQPRERLRTEGALVLGRRIVAVLMHVRAQRLLLGERLGADEALEGGGPVPDHGRHLGNERRVQHRVPLQAQLRGKPDVAVGTGKGLCIVQVHRVVTIQVVHLLESFAWELS